MELKELQEKVDEWIKSYGVRYFNELTNMTILTEEVGELARVMARKYGEQSFKEGEKDCGGRYRGLTNAAVNTANTKPTIPVGNK